jgi:hypothetical protein
MIIDPSWPGADLVSKGLSDLEAERTTSEALLVAVGAPRLRAAGLDVPAYATKISEPQQALYRLLAETLGDDAHSALNALLRRLISFEHALERF